MTGYHWAVEPPSERLLVGDIISQPSCFFKRAIYEQVGGLDADLLYTMYWDLWVRLWRAGAKFAFIDDTLSRVLWTPDAKTGGFGEARRKELERIIDQNASPIWRLKSRIGFALHHVFEYTLPEPVTRILRNKASKPPALIHGLGREGEISETAEIPLVRYGAPIARIEAFFSRGANSASLSLRDRGGATTTHQRDSVTLNLDSPAASGEPLRLTIKSSGPAQAILSHIALS